MAFGHATLAYWDIDVAVLFRHAAGVLFMEDAHRCARIPNRFG
jgi:hypothetical protein